MISAQEIKALRKSLGLDRYDFALAFGVPYEAVKAWEQGIHMPIMGIRMILSVIRRAPKETFETIKADLGRPDLILRAEAVIVDHLVGAFRKESAKAVRERLGFSELSREQEKAHLASNLASLLQED